MAKEQIKEREQSQIEKVGLSLGAIIERAHNGDLNGIVAGMESLYIEMRKIEPLLEPLPER